MTENSDGGENVNSSGEDRRNPVIRYEQQRVKADISRNATARIQSYERALRILPLVEQARAELKEEFHLKGYLKTVSNNAIAKRLNDYCKRPDGARFKPVRGETWSGRQIAENLTAAPQRIIYYAVLECRTRMTDLALSADFTKPIDHVTDLEREYLGYIAQAIDIEHRLHGNRNRQPDELLDEARHRAIAVAREQRAMKEVSMMARERLWKHYPPVIRKVFEDENDRLSRAES